MKITLIAWLMFIFYNYLNHFVSPIPFPPNHITLLYLVQVMIIILGFISSLSLACYLAELPGLGFIIGLALWILYYWL